MALREHDLRRDDGAAILAFPMHAVRARAAHERMLRRRRRSAGVAVVTVALGVLWSLPVAESGARPRSTTPASVRLAAGDTLWDVAETYAPPGSDLRAYVSELRELNGLARAPFPGEHLRLPK